PGRRGPSCRTLQTPQGFARTRLLQPVPPELVEERAEADTEQLGRLAAAPPRCLERTLNRHLFDALDLGPQAECVGAECRHICTMAVPVAVAIPVAVPAPCAAALHQKVGEVQTPGRVEHRGALDGVAQLAHVAGP